MTNQTSHTKNSFELYVDSVANENILVLASVHLFTLSAMAKELCHLH